MTELYAGLVVVGLVSGVLLLYALLLWYQGRQYRRYRHLRRMLDMVAHLPADTDDRLNAAENGRRVA